MPAMPVTRCICANRSFVQLQQLARQHALRLDQLADRTGATRGCGLCMPYVQRMLETGRCSFDADEAVGCARLPASPALSTFAQQRMKGSG
ncbi:MAG: (2Fe-2S)-binding protein [Phycisphaeraceae bacterium]